MTASRVPLVCESCGQVYAGRQAGEDLILPTPSGTCKCGDEEFTVLTNADGES